MIEYALSGKVKESETEMLDFIWEVNCIMPMTSFNLFYSNYNNLADMTGGEI